MFFDEYGDPKLGRMTAALIVLIAAALLCNGVAYLTDSLWYQKVQSPIERQNQNHDPNWLRQTESDYQTSYADFQAAQTALPGKIAAVAAFEKTHPNPSTWDYWTQQKYQTLYNDAEDDYQTEVNEASHYNALASNADTGPVRPAGLPASLTADPQPQIP